MDNLEETGGLKTDGLPVDPVSENEVPLGSNAEEVRDDVPAQLSDGEYVVPADVVRYFGVSFFEKLRDKAKKGIDQMAEDGRINGEPIDSAPTLEGELSTDEMKELEDVLKMQEGGDVDLNKEALQQFGDQVVQQGLKPQIDYGQFSTPGSFTAFNQAQAQQQAETAATQQKQSVGFAEYVGPNGQIMMIPIDAEGNPTMPVPDGYTLKTTGEDSKPQGGSDDPTPSLIDRHKDIQAKAQERNQKWFDNFHNAEDPLAMAKSLLSETPAGLGGIIGAGDTLGDIAKIRGYSAAIEESNPELAKNLNELVEDKIADSGFGVKALEGVIATGGMYADRFGGMVTEANKLKAAAVEKEKAKSSAKDRRDRRKRREDMEKAGRRAQTDIKRYKKSAAGKKATATKSGQKAIKRTESAVRDIQRGVTRGFAKGSLVEKPK